MNVLVLAHIQLKNEGKLNSKHYLSLLFDRAKTIVTYLDTCKRNRKVLQSRYGKNSKYRKNLIKKFEEVVSVSK